MFDDTILDYYSSLKPLKSYSLDKILLSQESPPEELSVSMELIGEGLEYPTLHVQFHGVRQLEMRLGHLSNAMDITPIKDRQWENLNYVVREAENHQISFYCSDFEVWLEENTSA
jgi:hypothetical protein